MSVTVTYVAPSLRDGELRTGEIVQACASVAVNACRSERPAFDTMAIVGTVKTMVLSNV